MKTILLTIKKKYFDKIVSGEKTLELRKTRFKGVRNPTPVFMHISGEKGVHGVCLCSSFVPIQASITKEQWKQFEESTQVDYAAFKSYTGNRKQIFGWQISNAKKFRNPVEIKCPVGQSWRYFETSNLGGKNVRKKISRGNRR